MGTNAELGPYLLALLVRRDQIFGGTGSAVTPATFLLERAQTIRRLRASGATIFRLPPGATIRLCFGKLFSYSAYTMAKARTLLCFVTF